MEGTSGCSGARRVTYPLAHLRLRNKAAAAPRGAQSARSPGAASGTLQAGSRLTPPGGCLAGPPRRSTCSARASALQRRQGVRSARGSLAKRERAAEQAAAAAGAWPVVPGHHKITGQRHGKQPNAAMQRCTRRRCSCSCSRGRQRGSQAGQQCKHQSRAAGGEARWPARAPATPIAMTGTTLVCRR